MAIEYTQRWLKDASAKISNLGWFKPKTYEVLKSQKGLTVDEPVLTEKIFVVTPSSEVNTGEIVPIEVRFLPRVATETDYTITVSDEEICTFNQENMTLVFKDKGGIVDIVVKSTNGDAESTKSITVNKLSTACYIEEGNAIVKDEEKALTFKLLPTDTTETITNVEIFNNPEISISPAEVADSFLFKSGKLGDYYAKVTTTKQSYKVAIHVILDDSLLVTSINLDGIKPAYKYNEEIYINPTFEPETATNTVFNVVVDDADIATYNPATKILKTGVKDGKTLVTINTIVGGNVKHDFQVVVNEEGENPTPDITGISLVNLPVAVEVGKKTQFTLPVEPTDADGSTIVVELSNDNAVYEYKNGIRTLEGKKNGTVKFTASSPDGKVTSNRDVSVITKSQELVFGTYEKNILSDGTKHDMPVTVLPEDTTYKGLKYTPYGVILIDSDNKYYAESVGEGYVIVRSMDGSGANIRSETIKVTEPVIKVTGIDVTGIPATMNVGDEATFVVNVTPSNATDKSYKWENSPNVTVTGNKIVANSPLDTSFFTVTSKDGSNISKKVDFAVKPINVTSINVTGIPSTIEVGKEGTFAVSVLPNNATDKTYTVTSSANVTVTGNKFVANSNGASSITVTANDGSGVSKVTNFTAITLVTDINVTGVPSEMVEGDVVNNITVEVLPTNASDKTFTASTSDEYNFTISADGTTLTAVGFGHGKLTYTANDGSGIKKEFDVFVDNPPPPKPERFQVDGFKEEMTVNETNSAYVSLMPLSTEQVWSCSSSNPEVATAVKGEVTLDITAIAVGTTTITLTADNDTSVKYEGTITVS